MLIINEIDKGKSDYSFEITKKLKEVNCNQKEVNQNFQIAKNKTTNGTKISEKKDSSIDEIENQVKNVIHTTKEEEKVFSINKDNNDIDNENNEIKNKCNKENTNEKKNEFEIENVKETKKEINDEIKSKNINIVLYLDKNENENENLDENENEIEIENLNENENENEHLDKNENENLIERENENENEKENLNENDQLDENKNENEHLDKNENENLIERENHKNETSTECIKSHNNEDSSNFNIFTRGRPSSCVFVASLCSNKSDDELCISVTNYFKKWGKLSTIKVLRDVANRPYAFVQYTNDQDCKLAIKQGHNSLLDGRSIRCELAKVNRTLFINSKDYLTEENVREHLGKFGEIEQLISSNVFGSLFFLKTPPKGSKSWICKFAYRDDAIRAFANLTDENIFKVEWAQNVEESDLKSGYKKVKNDDANKIKFDKFSIFVGQLNLNINEAQLKERFSRHGIINYINIIKKSTNTFAFIKYKDEFSAASAVERENHSMFNGKTMHVQYREIHVPNSKQIFQKKNGIILAPPPINLNRRLYSINVLKQNDVPRKTATILHNTFPMSKFKFNSYPSNNYNKSQQQDVNSIHYGKIRTKTNENSYHFNNKNKGSNLTLNKYSNRVDSLNKRKIHKYNEISNNKINREMHKENSTSLPSNVQPIDSYVVKSYGNTASNTVCGDKYEYIKNGKKKNKMENHISTVANTNGLANNTGFPFFYYISNSEGANLGNSANGKYQSNINNGINASKYYNLYQQCYLSFDGQDFQSQSATNFRIPPYSLYYQTDFDYDKFVTANENN